MASPRVATDVERRGREEIIDPSLPIIDPHHHLGHRPNARYLLEEFLQDIGDGGHDIRATVYIECDSMYRRNGPDAMRPVGEIEFASGVAAMSASGIYGPTRVCAGIVGYADLRLGPAVEEVLVAHFRTSGGRLRGIRQAAAWDAHNNLSTRRDRVPNLLGGTAFRAGFAKLAEADLVYDSWQYHPQLPEVTDLARAFPGTTIVVNHVGGPVGIGTYAGRRKEIFAVWKTSMRELSCCPNVYVKLGGLGEPLCGFGFDQTARSPSSNELAAAWRPYLETCIELFGPNRSMFESNFPADKVSCGYDALWNAFKKVATGCSVEEKSALFSATAARVYRLAIEQTP